MNIYGYQAGYDAVNQNK